MRIISIDKPRGWTSFSVVRFVKEKFQENKVGHLGTLDPLATGTLPIFLGKATRLIPLFNNVDKTYRAIFKLGESTDTFDTEGTITKKSDISSLNYQDIPAAIYSFLGEQKQNVPKFSAAKYKGVPFYKLVRKGISVPKKTRKVNFFELDIEKIELPFIQLSIRCSKGTYVRSMANDLGIMLNVGAHLTSLERLACGKYFKISNSISIEKLKNIVKDEDFPWISPTKILNHIYTINADEKMLSFIKNGRRVEFSRQFYGIKNKKDKVENKFIEKTNLIQTKVLDYEQNLIAIGFLLWENKSCYFQPSKVFI